MPQVSRVGDVDSDGDVMTIGSPTVFAGNAAFSPEFENAPITIPQEYDIQFVRANLSQTGRYAEFDDTESISLVPKTYPNDLPPITFDGAPKESTGGSAPILQVDEKDPTKVIDDDRPVVPPESSVPKAEKETPELDDCRLITLPINYNLRISDNYTIGNLSVNALFPHRIRAQVGLKEQDIVCNMEALAKNILEPIRAEFGPFRINSGFRVGSGKSAHNRGMAVDIQEPRWGNKKLFEVAKWVAKNLVFDQCLLEHGNAVWLHISFDRTKKKQRGQQMTMIRGKFQPGLTLYYN